MRRIKRPWLLFTMAIGCAIALLVVFSNWANATQPTALEKLDFASVIFERTTLEQAQTRLPFHVLQPTMPPGYQLAFVQIPRNQPTYVYLIYIDPKQRHALLIAESSVADQQAPTQQNLWGSTEKVEVNGQPALYFKGVPTEKQGEQRITINEDGHGLILEHAGVHVQLLGWRDAGIDKAMLMQIATSLK